jgi:hypothetical protein
MKQVVRDLRFAWRGAGALTDRWRFGRANDRRRRSGRGAGCHAEAGDADEVSAMQGHLLAVSSVADTRYVMISQVSILEAAAAVDRFLLRVNRPVQYTVIVATVLHMVAVAIPNVPRAYVDYSRFPLLSGVHQYETYGTDTIGNSYVAKVVLNDPLDMYTKARLEQTPLEKATWTREASAPYPPAALLTAAGLYAIGAATGIGFYGMVVLLAAVFIALSLWYFLKTRWYLFPALYLNFAYFGHRFVYVQDDTYLAMLVVVMIALVLARWRRDASHILMALAITMKLSPAAYAREILTMRRGLAIIFAAILFAGLVLPYFIWNDYLKIFTFHEQVKGNIYDTVAAVALAASFTIVLWYVETRLGFDMEDRIGWSLVPFAIFVGIKMRVARHLLIVLLVPDKRGPRNIAASIGLALYAANPDGFKLGGVLYLTTVLLFAVLAHYLWRIGWSTVRDDVRHPLRTARLLLSETRLT